MDSTKPVIATTLAQGEPLLWSGQPGQGLLFRYSDLLLTPFSLAWGGLAFCWTAAMLVTAVISGRPLFYFSALLGVPFVLVGLYMIAGRFWFDARVRAHTWFGLTDRRLIVVSGVAQRQIVGLPFDAITNVSLKERSAGFGTITLQVSESWDRPTVPGYWPSGASFGDQVYLENVEGAREVFLLLRQSVAAASKPEA